MVHGLMVHVTWNYGTCHMELWYMLHGPMVHVTCSTRYYGPWRGPLLARQSGLCCRGELSVEPAGSRSLHKYMLLD